MIKIKDKEAAQKYKDLIKLSEESKAAFLAAQEKAKNLKLQLEAKKSQLQELEKQKLKIENNLENAEVNNYGEIDFSKFNEEVKIISENTTKIKIIKKQINKDELNIKLTLLNELSMLHSNYRLSMFRLNEFLYKTLLKQLLDDNKFNNTINTLSTLINHKDKNHYQYEDILNIIITDLRSNISFNLDSNINIENYPNYIAPEFEIEHITGFEKKRLNEELQKELNKLNK